MHSTTSYICPIVVVTSVCMAIFLSSFVQCCFFLSLSPSISLVAHCFCDAPVLSAISDVAVVCCLFPSALSTRVVYPAVTHFFVVVVVINEKSEGKLLPRDSGLVQDWTSHHPIFFLSPSKFFPQTQVFCRVRYFASVASCFQSIFCPIGSSRWREQKVEKVAQHFFRVII